MNGQLKSNQEKVTCLFKEIYMICLHNCMMSVPFVTLFVGEKHPQSYEDLNRENEVNMVIRVSSLIFVQRTDRLCIEVDKPDCSV